jgi:uncharacterized membrane protein
MSRRLRLGMIALAVIGLGVATYLTIVHYVGFQILACSGAHGGHSSCQTVQSSVWSKVDGVPVALLGLIGYIGILASLLVPDREESRIATLGMTLIGVGFSGYLTYRELFSIHAICEWCVSSAIILAILLIGSIWRFILGEPIPSFTSEAGDDGADEPAPEPDLARPTA